MDSLTVLYRDKVRKAFSAVIISPEATNGIKMARTISLDDTKKKEKLKPR